MQRGTKKTNPSRICQGRWSYEQPQCTWHHQRQTCSQGWSSFPDVALLAIWPRFAQVGSAHHSYPKLASLQVMGRGGKENFKQCTLEVFLGKTLCHANFFSHLSDSIISSEKTQYRGTELMYIRDFHTFIIHMNTGFNCSPILQRSRSKEHLSPIAHRGFKSTSTKTQN